MINLGCVVCFICVKFLTFYIPHFHLRFPSMLNIRHFNLYSCHFRFFWLEPMSTDIEDSLNVLYVDFKTMPRLSNKWINLYSLRVDIWQFPKSRVITGTRSWYPKPVGTNSKTSSMSSSDSARLQNNGKNDLWDQKNVFELSVAKLFLCLIS